MNRKQRLAFYAAILGLVVLPVLMLIMVAAAASDTPPDNAPAVPQPTINVRMV